MIQFQSRKLIKPGDLNANNTLFGGQLLKWIDEEAGIYAMAKERRNNNHRPLGLEFCDVGGEQHSIQITRLQ